MSNWDHDITDQILNGADLPVAQRWVDDPPETAERKAPRRATRPPVVSGCSLMYEDDDGFELFVKKLRERLATWCSHEQLFWELQRRAYFTKDEDLVSYEEFQNRLKSRRGGAPFSADGHPLFEFDEGYLLDGVLRGTLWRSDSENWCQYRGWLPYQNDGQTDSMDE